MKSLEEKLQEYRITHKADEERMEDEVTALEDTLVTVKDSLEKRKRALEADIEADAVANGAISLPPTMMNSSPVPSAPFPTPQLSDRTSTGSEGIPSPSSVYPTLPVAAARSVNGGLNKVGGAGNKKCAAPGVPPPGTASSTSCSPEMSSRSDTPKTNNSDSSDFDCSV